MVDMQRRAVSIMVDCGGEEVVATASLAREVGRQHGCEWAVVVAGERGRRAASHGVKSVGLVTRAERRPAGVAVARERPRAAAERRIVRERIAAAAAGAGGVADAGRRASCCARELCGAKAREHSARAGSARLFLRTGMRASRYSRLGYLRVRYPKLRRAKARAMALRVVVAALALFGPECSALRDEAAPPWILSRRSDAAVHDFRPPSSGCSARAPTCCERSRRRCS